MKTKQHNIKSPNRIDTYIGKRVELQRRGRGLGPTDICRTLNISNEEFFRLEKGQARFPVSAVFDLKRHHNFNTESFFNDDGEYYSDVILDGSEMSDVFHYFSNIEDPAVRAHLLNLMKDASSVF